MLRSLRSEPQRKRASATFVKELEEPSMDAQTEKSSSVGAMMVAAEALLAETRETQRNPTSTGHESSCGCDG